MKQDQRFRYQQRRKVEKHISTFRVERLDKLNYTVRKMRGKKAFFPGKFGLSLPHDVAISDNDETSRTWHTDCSDSSYDTIEIQPTGLHSRQHKSNASKSSRRSGFFEKLKNKFLNIFLIVLYLDFYQLNVGRLEKVCSSTG